MYKVELKFSASSYIKDFTSEDTKESIVSNIKSAFKDSTLYTVYESEHNLVVEHNEYSEETNSKTILRIVFDDKDNVVALYLFDVDTLKFDAITLDNKEVKYKYLDSFINTCDTSELISYCPYINKRVKPEVIEKNTNIKLCDTEESNCKNCLRRSRAYISTDLEKENLHLEYSIEQYHNLFITDMSIKNNIDLLYGYTKDIDNLFILDTCTEQDDASELIIDDI